MLRKAISRDYDLQEIATKMEVVSIAISFKKELDFI